MPTDEMLVLEIQQGSRHALAELVRRHHGALVGYLYRMADGDRMLAEDMVQEAFLRVLRSVHQYAYPRPFKPWLYRIATNLIRDHYKSAGIRRTVALAEALDISSAETPEAAAAAVDDAGQVRAALAALPVHQREAIVLRYYQGLSLGEIAEALNVPVGTVKSRLSLGLKQLHKLLDAR